MQNKLKAINEKAVINPLAGWLYENIICNNPQETALNLQNACNAVACYIITAYEQQESAIIGVSEFAFYQLTELVKAIQQAGLSWEEYKQVGDFATDAKIFLCEG